MDYIEIFDNEPSYRPPSEIVRYTENQSRLSIRLVANEKNKYVLPVNEKNNNILYLPNINQDSNKDNLEPTSTISVNDCVLKCQEILGLKINEIAKLTGVSRATLDLHRKGANVKDMTAYTRIYDFVSKIHKQFGNNIKGGIRNVLIERKTLVQHFMRNIDDLDKTLPLVEEVSKKLKEMNIIESHMDATKSNLRLSGIGRIA